MSLILLLIILNIFIIYFKTYPRECFEQNQEQQKHHSPIKIAFLFLTIDNLKLPKVWESFFEKNNSKYTIYCHPKYPDKVSDLLLKNNLIPENIPTSWGGIGTIRANISMMEHALKDPDNQYFILCSESCVPIVPFDTLYNFILEEKKTIIPYFTQNLERYDNIIQPQGSRDNFKKHCAQGLVFRRDHANLLVSQNETKNWENVYCVDEHYFFNILNWKGIDTEQHITSYKMTFDMWGSFNIDESGAKNRGIKSKAKFLTRKDFELSSNMPASYKKINKKFLDILVDSGYFFMRKITPQLQGQDVLIQKIC